VREGDVFVIVNGGGGGLGDPLLRDPGLVAKDVDDGYVGAELAKAVYGVVLDGDGAADSDATVTERSAVRERRLGHAPVRELRPDDQLEVGIAIQLRNDRWSCAYCGGDLGPADADFRAACTSRTEPVSEAHERLGMQIRARSAAPDVMMTEHFCPECASAIHTDIGMEGQPLPPGPRLARIAELTG
jgi:N-methylhydantoinase B